MASSTCNSFGQIAMSSGSVALQLFWDLSSADAGVRQV